MSCKRCRSDSHSVFNGEIAIHFPGLKGLDKSTVWTFPKLAVCLECGFTEFTVPKRELSVLATGEAVAGAVVLEKKVARSLTA
jgi:predicted nucleic-acid-binding Zn-ribbon protein